MTYDEIYPAADYRTDYPSRTVSRPEDSGFLNTVPLINEKYRC
jgi:hypothetical protein